MRKVTNENLENVHEYNVLLDSREIFLHGCDTDDSGVDHRMATNFIKNLKILERSSAPIIIHQYSIGGDWSAGMAIFDAIRQSPCSFIFICYGVAASMGSIIPQAVLEKGFRLTHRNCDWLIHEGDLYLEGIPTRAKSNLEYMDLNSKTMYDIYTDCCSYGEFFKDYNRSKIKAYLKRKIREKTDWCFNGDTAVNYGFADGVLGTEGWENIKTIKESL